MEILQSIVEPLPLPDVYFDFKRFSSGIELYDYQQGALKNVAKLLYYFYQLIEGDRKKLWQEYVKRGFSGKFSAEGAEILKRHFGEVSYEVMINRACFWMATGSGKTLVIVKLIELLDRLMECGIIPRRDILFLTHREDLIYSFKRHVNMYNSGNKRRIFLENLKEYNTIKAGLKPFINGIPVFFYRSDLISDEGGEKRLDYRYFFNGGNWYLILDEAHKGDSEESKRKQIFSVFVKNGFMFNFSATFTEEFDRATTVYRFNLADFVAEGYGKHIAVMGTQTAAFDRKRGELSEEREKRKVVGKVLILTSFLRFLRDKRYPSPLAVVLVNTVNTRDSDLKLFFKELFHIAKEGISESEFQTLKRELLDELKELNFWYEGGKLRDREVKLLTDFSLGDFYFYLFSSDGPSDLEVIFHPENRQELLLKLRGGREPFALVKLGDVIDLLRELSSSIITYETFEKENYFLNLDRMESISLLIGSRSFYEGWDSPRPNVICFINIGKRNAHKFVLQSIGRGVRVKVRDGDREYKKRRDLLRALETLFVFATSRNSVFSVINETLKNESREPAVGELKRSSPTRRKESKTVLKVGKGDLREAVAFLKNVAGDEVLSLLTGYDLGTVRRLKQVIFEPKSSLRIVEGKRYRDPVYFLKELGKFVNGI